MRHLIALAALAAALLAAAAAQAGGWATVGFAPLPDGVGPGESWSPRITVLQHGRTPLGGLTPVVTIEEESSGESRSFTAAPAGELGVYETTVVFPSVGSWRVAIDSGFGDSRVTYGPVSVGAPAAPGDTGRFGPLAVLLVGGTLVLAGAAVLAARRGWRLSPAGR